MIPRETRGRLARADDVEFPQPSSSTSLSITVFVRVPTHPNPIAVTCEPRTTIRALKASFVEAYRSTVTSPTSTVGWNCRIVFKGKELADALYVCECDIKNGDHLHAIVREHAPNDEQQPRESRADALRSEAENWVRQVRQLLQQRNQQQPPDAVGGVSTDAVAAPREELPLLSSGAAELGGVDGETEVVVDREEEGTTTTTGSSSQTISVHSLITSVSQSPGLTCCGGVFGFLVGFAALLFVLAGKEISFEVRFGCGCGILLNVFFATLLPSPTEIAIRQ